MRIIKPLNHDEFKWRVFGLDRRFKKQKEFVAYYYFVGWSHISLGFHICLAKPNIEIHLPFGFVRIGVA